MTNEYKKLCGTDLDSQTGEPWHEVDDKPFNHPSIVEVLKAAFYGRGSECVTFNGSQMAYTTARVSDFIASSVWYNLPSTNNTSMSPHQIEFVVRSIDLHETGRTDELQDRHEELLGYLRETTNNWKLSNRVTVLSPGVVELGVLELVRNEETVFDSMIASPPKPKRRRNIN